jgi:hypothetical protein
MDGTRTIKLKRIIPYPNAKWEARIKELAASITSVRLRGSKDNAQTYGVGVMETDDDGLDALAEFTVILKVVEGDVFAACSDYCLHFAKSQRGDNAYACEHIRIVLHDELKRMELIGVQESDDENEQMPNGNGKSKSQESEKMPTAKAQKPHKSIFDGKTDYQPPTGGGYMKFEEGDNRFRIIGETIITGWKYWEDKTPVRVREENELPTEVKSRQGGDAPRHFWGMVVWNYKANRVQVLEVVQATVIKSMYAFIEDEEWGDPRGYDFVVNRATQGGRTTYMVKTRPPSEVPDCGDAHEQINLHALYENQSPFGNEEE